MVFFSDIVSRLKLHRKTKSEHGHERTMAPSQTESAHQNGVYKNTTEKASPSPSTDSRSSTTPSSPPPVPQTAPVVDVDKLEFSASRHLARELDQDSQWTSPELDKLTFPAFEFLLQPAPAPTTDHTNTMPRKSSYLRKRLSVYKTKSALLKRSRSTPNFAAS
ncbi:uncharacterized protein BYT42DRAFT_558906 [Radiomyces spectabilis]|uniref:uncharacterized protein n=1 Tax=Radiomyces spectabilis TaxID=64574 RepID=UPI00221EE0EF|nr:uncharacterized protein BYT42DRAFT_558906 [Radiomyces spectabilis]KAI8388094.1 hypothetical protein BYT42DRAFT_558906 [Radiomyces spectabilis]